MSRRRCPNGAGAKSEGRIGQLTESKRRQSYRPLFVCMIAAENRIRLKASPRFAHSTRSKITLAIPRDLTAWPDFRGDRVVPATRNTWQKTGIGGGTGIDSFRSKRGISSVLPSGGE